MKKEQLRKGQKIQRIVNDLFVKADKERIESDWKSHIASVIFDNCSDSLIEILFQEID